jgi:CubicO group peptidase (beta-lactamase class C family)
MNLVVSWRLRATTSAIILAAWVALFPLMASAAPAAAPHATPDFGAIDAYVLAQMSMEHIPGVALGIVHGNQIVHLRGFGVADQAGAAVTPQTDFSISSMTKSFTAVAIMQLVEQGQVALDAPVQRYLPWFRVATPGASATITVRELLNQTSGISHYAGNLVIAGDKAETMKQAAQALATLPLDTPPGAAFQYSNVNYVTLGLIVEAASGQPYATYVQQHIFAPLQMTSSATIVNPPPQRDMATGYHWWYGLPVASSYRNPPDDLPAGGIISNAQDMAHYLIAHLNGGSYGSVSILTPDSIALLHHAIVFPSVTTDPYAMGWYDVHVDRTPVLWHSGDDPNFQADMALIPQGQWGVVVLRDANSELSSFTSPPLFSIPAGVIAMLLGHQPHATGTPIHQVFLILDVVMLLLTALVVWSSVRLARRWKRSLKRTPMSLLLWVIAPLLWEVALPLTLVFALPTVAKAPWSVALIFLPDLGFWLLGISALLLITGFARLTHCGWQMRQAAGQSRQSAPVASGVA